MFLKNKNIIFKIRRSKVTDYAALRRISMLRKFLLVSARYRRVSLAAGAAVLSK